jgi:ornithine carbamoyltransferase
MGQEEEAEERARIFQPYQVNEALVAEAKPDVIIMHCLPAHRGQEITDGICDGPHSVLWDQAENRMHAQKAVLVELMG